MIASQVWKNTALLPEKEIRVRLNLHTWPTHSYLLSYHQELKDAFFANINNSKSKPPSALIADNNVKKDPSLSKPTKKPVLKKRAAAEDPFASDEEEDQKSKKQKTGDSWTFMTVRIFRVLILSSRTNQELITNTRKPPNLITVLQARGTYYCWNLCYCTSSLFPLQFEI